LPAHFEPDARFAQGEVESAYLTALAAVELHHRQPVAAALGRAVCWDMLTPKFHGAVGRIVANPGVLLALGAALTVVWLLAALISALRRRRVK
jgi:hypothetical protein